MVLLIYLDYIGKVKVIKRNLDGTRVEIDLSNSGTDNLFKFLVNCLLGNLDKSAVPSYIDLRLKTPFVLDESNSGSLVEKVVSITAESGSPIVSSTVNEVDYNGETYLAAQFVSNFSTYDFNGVYIDTSNWPDDSVPYLTVVGNDKFIELTTLNLTETDFKDITMLDDNQRVSIEWTMLIKNNVSEDNNV